MIKNHEIELHLAHWRKAIVEFSGENRSQMNRSVNESAEEIGELLGESALRARCAIDAAVEISRFYLYGGPPDESIKRAALDSIRTLHFVIEPNDLIPRKPGPEARH